MVKVKINIKPIETETDPSIKIYQVTIEREPDCGSPSVWQETFGSKELTEAFLKGVKSAFSFFDMFPVIPPIP